MYLSHLAVDDFRSYRHAVVEFEPGVSALIGLNGQGKTNLVEAIAYLATFSSHRVAADTALVRAGCDAAVVRAKVHDGDRTSIVEVEILAGRANRARLNRSPVRTRELLGIVHCVVFAPEDLALVKGDPAVRRRFLDELLIQITPRLAGVKSDYERVLRQRGALLKSARNQRRAGRGFDTSSLDIWDEQIADLGSTLIHARAGLVRALRPHVVEAYHRVSHGQSQAHIDLHTSILAGDNSPNQTEKLHDREWIRGELLAALHDQRDKEIERAVTLSGPHRDELMLTLNELPARGYSSHGESWSLALALRLASFELLQAEETTGSPILILDDVFAELDTARRQQLAALVAPVEQVFITAAVPSDIPAELNATRYRVSSSTISGWDEEDREENHSNDGDLGAKEEAQSGRGGAAGYGEDGPGDGGQHDGGLDHGGEADE
ncbi:MAG: DNA replication/repair protein RecF [Bowdeniella nasicola]|nr:DNA replication/repair protein RecF [Bowdeniella nasicola]